MQYQEKDRVICNGYPGMIVRHYSENMYEVKLARGMVCVDQSAIKPDPDTARAINFSKLPSVCAAYHPDDKRPILIQRGFEGYSEIDQGIFSVEKFNQDLNVTPAQREAMLAGSMFGFHVRGASPDLYDENGKPKSV